MSALQEKYLKVSIHYIVVGLKIYKIERAFIRYLNVIWKLRVSKLKITVLKSTGLHISSTQKLRYTYETEAVLNEADIHPEDKIYRMNSDVGR